MSRLHRLQCFTSKPQLGNHDQKMGEKTTTTPTTTNKHDRFIAIIIPIQKREWVNDSFCNQERERNSWKREDQEEKTYPSPEQQKEQHPRRGKGEDKEMFNRPALLLEVLSHLQTKRSHKKEKEEKHLFFFNLSAESSFAFRPTGIASTQWSAICTRHDLCFLSDIIRITSARGVFYTRLAFALRKAPLLTLLRLQPFFTLTALASLIAPRTGSSFSCLHRENERGKGGRGEGGGVWKKRDRRRKRWSKKEFTKKRKVPTRREEGR